ncbi:membrane protein insertase YidC [Desulfococcaceae bacterium HSG9]|nr:membrane protein insertase YidC [Desulfococcaceae bacterium HSG9]
MEQGRLFLAIGLSLLVFLVWNFLFVDNEAIQRQQRARQDEIRQKQDDIKHEETVAISESAPSVEMQKAGETVETDTTLPLKEATDERPARQLTIKTPFYTVGISEKGALFTSFLLHNYKENASPDSPLYQMAPYEIKTGNITLEISGNQLNDLNNAVFHGDMTDNEITIEHSPRRVIFTWQSQQGIIVQKEYLFTPQSYKIGLAVKIINKSDRDFQGQALLGLKKVMPKEIDRFGFSGPSAFINNTLEQIALDDIAEKNIYAGQVDWIALEDRYFMSALIPVKKQNGELRLNVNGANLITSQYASPPMQILSNMQTALEYQIFIGPKKVSILKQTGHQLDKAVDFGWFDFIARPCLAFMNFLYQYIPNYGVVIIILTLLIKLILWPLGTKGYKSMAEMKKLQPLMAEVKEKYKGDKKRIQEETMQLYKTYKINPIGGCLPMVVQIPVFFAFYRMLYQAIELRHAPFFGWITDMSAPDRLGNFGFSIPFMDAPYGIPVLTIIMGVTMFLQQKMSPPVGDATQAKVMQFMPLAFTVIFINFSAGLVLYWLINNVVSIAQQYYTQKKTL